MQIHSDLLLFLAQQTELQINVVELPAKNSSGALHYNGAALQGHLNCKETDNIQYK